MFLVLIELSRQSSEYFDIMLRKIFEIHIKFIQTFYLVQYRLFQDNYKRIPIALRSYHEIYLHKTYFIVLNTFFLYS